MSEVHAPSGDSPFRRFAPVLVLPGGAAAIGWQLLWQHQAGLALGVSAQATALVVATMMAGMTAGALVAARWLPRWASVGPWRLYAVLEGFAALSGNLFAGLRDPIAHLDAAAFQTSTSLAPWVHAAAIVVAIGPATLAIGATLPLLGLLAQRLEVPVSRLYAINTAGAALGALWFPFGVIPLMGATGSAAAVTALQLTGALACWGWGRRLTGRSGAPSAALPAPIAKPVPHSAVLAFATGAVTFVLEVTWFRTIRSAWLSTVDSFAVVLFAFLIALAAGAWIAPALQGRGRSLPTVLSLAGLLILAASLGIAHLDRLSLPSSPLAWKLFLWLILALVTMGPPIALLGTSLPWLFDAAREPREWGRLYAWNTAGSTLGAIGAGWLLLRVLSPSQAAWSAGIVLTLFAIWLRRAPWSLVPAVFVMVATFPPDRIGGASTLLQIPHRVLAKHHGPDVTTAVIETRGGRALIIDGYAATGEFGRATNYMDAMGRLPMLLHENPRDALVICFGTGQTAHALRDERAITVTAVDVNPAVFRLAPHFPSNLGVLDDPRVTAVTMDGRAWLRRSGRTYDVITLEPMPPMFTGSNALYSVEFYRLIAVRLRPGGIAAQWFPLHLLPPQNARSVAAAFLAVFPDAVLWIDPSNADPQGTPQQGILLGSAGPRDWDRWPGFSRPDSPPRPLEERTYRGSIALRTAGLREFAQARPVTDDNLLLTHGAGRHLPRIPGSSPARETLRAIDRAALKDSRP